MIGVDVKVQAVGVDETAAAAQASADGLSELARAIEARPRDPSVPTMAEKEAEIIERVKRERGGR